MAVTIVDDCDVLREIETLLGVPQGSDPAYIDHTGIECGPATCIECGRDVEIAYLRSRPGGESPAILDAHRAPEFGSWYLFRTPDLPQGVILAEYLGRSDPRARFWNHRLVCPASRVALEANPQGGATDATRPESRPEQS